LIWNGTADYQHPSELYANSKEHAKNLLLANVPAESIFGIFTEDEYIQRFCPNAKINVSSQSTQQIRKC
jgi:hypothetical protein